MTPWINIWAKFFGVVKKLWLSQGLYFQELYEPIVILTTDVKSNFCDCRICLWAFLFLAVSVPRSLLLKKAGISSSLNDTNITHGGTLKSTAASDDKPQSAKSCHRLFFCNRFRYMVISKSCIRKVLCTVLTYYHHHLMVVSAGPNFSRTFFSSFKENPK